MIGSLDILVTTPNRLVHLLSLEPPGISLNWYQQMYDIIMYVCTVYLVVWSG